MQTRTILVLLLLAACCTAPAYAAVKYIDSSPSLTALVSGSNEFSPGQDATITIILQNTGLNTFKFANDGTIARDDLPNTAKLVTVRLAPVTGLLAVKTDPQSLGDIAGGGTAVFSVKAKIADTAASGDYTVPLAVQYRYLESSPQEASDNMQFIYKDVNTTLPLKITVKPHVRITVLSSTTEALNVGTEGYLHLSIRNDGSDNGKKATVKLTRSGTSPVIPVSGEVFIGDFSSGGTVNCTYKASVSDNAGAQTYPVDVSVTYEDNEGKVVTSDTVTIGVPVGGKTVFSVTSAPAQITAGQAATIEVVYRNDGSDTAYAAQARVSAVPPFTGNDATAYLGDILPGQTATARYALTAAASAEPKGYALDSEIRYRDTLGNSQTADTVRVNVTVVPRTESPLSPANPIILCLLAAVIIGAGYYLLVMRKKL